MLRIYISMQLNGRETANLRSDLFLVIKIILNVNSKKPVMSSNVGSTSNQH